MKRILKFEEYVAKRKQEDMLNEFDKTMRNKILRLALTCTCEEANT
jgi:hypothetical protein